jgi:membrane protease YdiL (CAAX protease family)
VDEPVAADATGAPVRPVRWGLGDFVWIYLAGLLLGNIAGAIGFGITGDSADHPGALTYGLSAAGLYLAWGVGLVYCSRRKGRGTLAADFGLAVSAKRLWALPAGIAVLLASSLLVYPLRALVNYQDQKVVDDLRNASGGKLVVLWLIAGLLAPVFEELMFRGLLLRSLRRRLDPEWAIGISALLFACLHLLGDASLGVVALVPALFLLGLVSGIAAVRVGDLSVSIPLHMGFNLVTLATAVLLLR